MPPTAYNLSTVRRQDEDEEEVVEEDGDRDKDGDVVNSSCLNG